MADIAALAGVAKQTLYSHFADKEALFRAVITQVRKDHMPTAQPAAPLADTIPTPPTQPANPPTNNTSTPPTPPPDTQDPSPAKGTPTTPDPSAAPDPLAGPARLASPAPLAGPDPLARPNVLGGPDLLTALAGLGTYLVTLITDPELAALRRITLTDPHWADLWSLDGPAPLRAALTRELGNHPELDVPDPALAADHFLALVTHRAVLDSLSQTTRPLADYRVMDACVTFLRAFRKSSAAVANSGLPSDV